MPARLLSFLASDSIQQKQMVDIILMAALADGALSQDTLDRIGRAMQTHPELEGLSWDWVVQRENELALDAPLFSDARQALVQGLVDPAARRLGISLGARIVGAGRPLRDEERAILYDLGLEFGIDGFELNELLDPKDDAEEPKVFLRAASNDPAAPNAPSLFDAFANVKSDEEARLFTYKLGAIRRILDELLPGSSLISVGETFRMGPHESRVDAVIDVFQAGQCILRCLADGEALHPEEHRALAGLTGELQELSFLMIAHQASISPMDQAFLKGLDPTKLRVEKVDIWASVP